jgi:hypothetical protein
MGFGAEFFSAMDVAKRPTVETSIRVFTSMPAPEFVRRWYVMLYQIIRATGPVIRHASYELTYDGFFKKDDFCCDLRAYFDAKESEEDGHERLLLADLARVGIHEEEAEDAPVNPWIAEMVGRQYYLIDFVHPAAYLGFVGLLEGFPPTLAQVDAVQAASGFPAEAFSCMRLHAAADPGHRASLSKMLDEVPSDLHADIITNGQRCAALQCAALEHLSQQESLP